MNVWDKPYPYEKVSREQIRPGNLFHCKNQNADFLFLVLKDMEKVFDETGAEEVVSAWCFASKDPRFDNVKLMLSGGTFNYSLHVAGPDE